MPPEVIAVAHSMNTYLIRSNPLTPISALRTSYISLPRVLREEAVAKRLVARSVAGQSYLSSCHMASLQQHLIAALLRPAFCQVCGEGARGLREG